ncbi:PadR family transcriptional regulator [Nocardia yunnanensis]|uniref:PadR family transcriptional regulator n=1 Tax=Nocardia yunnanensis TaxID=2382165 RepID=A0A386ZL09_9NOCA|nr:PadR family transcriptional regulator [Nocardia yunnanensis]AYF77319.1 PadR family transcriptional regulator [Nocardia yunnanensis]
MIVVAQRAFRRVNPLALAVLVQLWERPMHPYQISQTLKQRGKDSSVRINYGALYPVVESLQKHGFIEVVGAEQDGGRPARTVYRITDAGVAEMREWLRAWISEPEKEYPRFMAALSFLPALGPDEAVAVLRRRIAVLDKRIGEMREATEAVVSWLPEVLLIEGDYEMRMLGADRDFTAELADRIEAGRLGGIEGWRAMTDLLARYPDGAVPPAVGDGFLREWGLPTPPEG